MHRLIFGALLGMGCGDDKSGDGSDAGGNDTASGSDTGTGWVTSCPDEVPEQYKYIWNCEAGGCDNGHMVYHYGVGSSDEDGNFTVVEQWFMFGSSGAGTESHDWCMDTWEITGASSLYDPEVVGCSSCEEIYEVDWTLTSGNQCSMNWGYTWIDDEDEVTGPFSGFLLFDTHTAFGDRNPDDAMLVFSAPVSGTYYYPDADYGRGTATPTGEEDGPPEDYEWVSTGACWTSAR